MARTTAPLLSLGASGSIAKSIVFSKWKGVPYARQHVIPANPQSTAQTAQRDLFKWVHDAYKYLDGAAQEGWIAFAKGKPMTAPNAWQSKNNVALSGASDIDDIIFIPAVLGGPPNVSTTLTAGANQITAVGVPPALPTGWAIVQMIAVCMIQQVPSGEKEPNPSATMTKSASPWSVVFTGLTTASPYVVGIGWKFTRSDAATAFGGSSNSDATPT